MSLTTLPLSERVRQGIRVALFQQVPFAVLCLLLLDFGRTARLCGIALIAFWSMVALILARRPISPSPADLVFLRYGFWPVFALVVLVAFLAGPR
jgi:hypothetical protein